jgi:hypothetical protein
MVAKHPGAYRPKYWESVRSRKGQAVAREAQQPVAILYKHALLGEGIATYLRTRINVEATVVSAHNPAAVRSALALCPAVIIFESSDPFQQLDLATLAPQAVLIDVSTVVTRGSVVSPDVAGLKEILDAVRDSKIIARPLGPCHGPADLYLKSTVRRMGTPE